MSRRGLTCSGAAVVLSLFAQVLLFPPHVQSSANFSFPAFSSHDGFLALGNIKHNPETASFTIQPNTSQVTLYGDQLVFTEKVRMKNLESNAVASFSTSFTFSITQLRDQQFAGIRSGWLGHACGFIFVIASEFNATIYAGHVDLTSDYFGVEFDTYNSYGDEDPSDNHIGVNINSVKSAYTYNLCGDQRTSCTFPWTGQRYTALIVYNASTQSLEIWFASGSLATAEVKSTGARFIQVPKVDLRGAFREYMYVIFSGNPGPFSDSYEILSWNFTADYLEYIPAAPGFILNVAAACAIALLIAVCMLGYWWIMRSSVTKDASVLEINALMGLRRFSFKELKKATKNFNDDALLGKGGSGSVYKGVLRGSDTEVVAVKRLKHDSEHVEKAFLAEVSTVSQMRHRHLVQLLGWCHEGNNFMLVFEYMSNGSVDEWLFPSRRRHPQDPKFAKFKLGLPWELRVSILAGVAAAVEYMHGDWVQCVLHRDIKSSNVMMDDEFNPHLGDFGLFCLIDHKKQEKTTLMAGTLGYMAPEMYYTGKATKESDVYSFGVLILEVVCGRKPINLLIEDPETNCLLVQNVWRAYEGGNILNAIDPELLSLYSQQLKPDPSNMGTEDFERILVVPLLHLGLHCCSSDPTSRPSMRVVKQVILQLQGSAAEGTMAMLKLMPPLSSTMPVYSFFSHVPEPFIKAMEREMPLDDGQVSFLPRTDTMSLLRRRSDEVTKQ